MFSMARQFRRPENWLIHDLDMLRRYFVRALISTAEQVVLYVVAAERIGSSVPCSHQKRIEKRSVMAAVIYGAMISFNVSAAKCL